jgi:hypothetical protein
MLMSFNKEDTSKRPIFETYSGFKHILVFISQDSLTTPISKMEHYVSLS